MSLWGELSNTVTCINSTSLFNGRYLSKTWSYIIRSYANRPERISSLLKQRRVVHAAAQLDLADRQSKNAERAVSKRRKL
jgi:hypothetical protein